MQIFDGRIYFDMTKLLFVAAFFLVLPRTAVVICMLIAVMLCANAMRTGSWRHALDFDAPEASDPHMWKAIGILATGLSISITATGWMF